MIKNLKLSTVITGVVSVVVAVCMLMLFLLSNNSMMTAMKETSINNMNTSLEAKTQTIEEYVENSECLMLAYSKAPVLAELLKNPGNAELQKEAQDYTMQYYEGLEQWEGLYLCDWDTHVLTHSNKSAVGMTVRTGDALSELQSMLTQKKDVFNVGILVSPASEKLLLSLYCPVFDEDGSTILGFVGGGTYAEGLNSKLNSLAAEGMEQATCYMIDTENKMYIMSPDEKLIASEIEDKMLLSVIGKVGQGKDINGSFEYIGADGNEYISIYSYMPQRGSETATQIQMICNETNANIEDVKKCFSDIIHFLESDVSAQFKEFAGIAGEYSVAIDMFRHIIDEIREASDIFAGSVSVIKEQMNTVQYASDDNETGVEEIITKNERTNVTAENLAGVLKTNQDSTMVIQKIIEKFTV